MTDIFIEKTNPMRSLTLAIDKRIDCIGFRNDLEVETPRNVL
jgi:hypothetical protein